MNVPGLVIMLALGVLVGLDLALRAGRLETERDRTMRLALDRLTTIERILRGEEKTQGIVVEFRAETTGVERAIERVNEQLDETRSKLRSLKAPTFDADLFERTAKEQIKREAGES